MYGHLVLVTAAAAAVLLFDVVVRCVTNVGIKLIPFALIVMN